MSSVGNGKLLDKAVNLFKRHRYAEAVDLMTPYLLAYGDSYLYFKLMTFSSIMIYDWSGAAAYLKTAVRLCRRRDPDLQIAQAVVKLQTGETAEAYLILFDLERNSRWGAFSKELLEISRNTENQQALTEILERLIKTRFAKLNLDGNYEREWRKRDSDLRLFFERMPSLRSIIAAGMGVFIIFLSALFIFMFFFKSAPERESVSVRKDGDNIKLQQTEQLVVYDSETRYLLSEEEIRNSFNRMKDYYRNRDDNMTQREINRLKESNASVDVKDKASAFERLLTDNRSENIGTLFSYDEVSHDPFLYDKTVVVWRGAAANLYVTPTSLTFDLLVGYENRKFLEGTVPVFVDYGVKIIEGEPYEIEGEITVDGDEHFRLHALSIRRIQIN